MLGGLIVIGFSGKCKSLIKPIRTQIDVLRRGKEATKQFLKNNLAQLIANRHYISAFEKTEEYITELNSVLCYDFIDESCVFILKQLSTMQKRSECPEECIETVGSLVYAAAKYNIFELRMLRDTFKERYGKSLERFVNQEFVANLASKPPTAEKKIKVLEDIAEEYTIKWNSEDLKQMLANNPSLLANNPSASGESNGSEKKMANRSASMPANGCEQIMLNPSASENGMTDPPASWDSRAFEQMLANPCASWDSRLFEQMMANPSANAQQVQPKRYGPMRYVDDTEASPKDMETLTIIYKRMTSMKDRNDLGSDKYRPNIGSMDVNLSESEKSDQRYLRNEELARKGRFSSSGLSAGSEQSSPTRDNYALMARSRGKFTQFNNDLWSTTVKEESSAKIVGKRAEFANGTYMRRTTIV